AVVAFATLFGCDSTNECDAKGCERVDREPQTGDFVIDLDTETALVHFSIDGHESDQGLRGGEVVFTSDDPACSASSTTPCTITLVRLRLELSSATLPTSDGDVRLDEPVVSVRTP